jgi:hypothetical protein
MVGDTMTCDEEEQPQVNDLLMDDRAYLKHLNPRTQRFPARDGLRHPQSSSQVFLRQDIVMVSFRCTAIVEAVGMSVALS